MSAHRGSGIPFALVLVRALWRAWRGRAQRRQAEAR